MSASPSRQLKSKDCKSQHLGVFGPPITSFEAKKEWLFPRRGKYKLPSSHKNSFCSSPSCHGKLAIFRERSSYFQGKMIPQRDNFPSVPLRENSPNFPFEKKFASKDV